jgi:outer membrane protein assembly factor BamB
MTERKPGADRIAEDDKAGSAIGSSRWEGKLVVSNGLPSSLQGAWPQFRGPGRDNINAESIPLAQSWGESGPKVLWRIPVGEGFAGPIIWRGRVYLTDYDHTNKFDALRCLSLNDGKEIWRYAYPTKVKRNHGMSRTVPALTDKYLVSLGPKCQVICVKPDNGELIWQMDLVRQFNAEVPPWYAGQCPLIDGDRAILATGGDALLVAVDCITGQVVWKSENPLNWQMTHASITPMDFQGTRMYIYCGSGGVAAVSAVNGSILWQTTEWKISIATVPSPLDVGEGRVFLSGGYNAGSMMLKMEQQDGKWTVKTLFRLKPAVFGATQHTPVFHQGHIFGIRPDGQFVCLDLNGKSVWESGADSRYGNGPFLFAGNYAYLVNDNGLLTLAEATPSGFKKVAQSKVLQGPDAWGPLALADGRLLARDLNEMICVDVSKKAY